MRLGAVGLAVLAAVLVGCGGSHKPTAAEIARDRLLAELAVKSIHANCKPGEVEVAIRRPHRESSACVPATTAATVEGLFRPRK